MLKRRFGTTGTRPVDGRKLQARADKAWREAPRDEAGGLLDAYLEAQRERAEESARSAGAAATGALTGAPVAHDA